MIPVFSGGAAREALEAAGKMSHIGKAGRFRDIQDPHGRIREQFLSPADPERTQQVKKTLAGFPVQQLGKVPLAHINMIGHFSQRQVLFGTVFLHIGQRRTDQVVSRRADGFLR